MDMTFAFVLKSPSKWEACQECNFMTNDLIRMLDRTIHSSFEPRPKNRRSGLRFKWFFSVPPVKHCDSSLKSATTASFHLLSITQNSAFRHYITYVVANALLNNTEVNELNIRAPNWIYISHGRHVIITHFTGNNFNKSCMYSELHQHNECSVELLLRAQNFAWTPCYFGTGRELRMEKVW